MHEFCVCSFSGSLDKTSSRFSLSSSSYFVNKDDFFGFCQAADDHYSESDVLGLQCT